LKLEFSQKIFKGFPTSNFMKILEVGSELFRADRQKGGQTDRHYKANAHFSQFCERA
jgi:hypothetical protein